MKSFELALVLIAGLFFRTGGRQTALGAKVARATRSR
jgi:hypothetical protein